MKCAIYARVSKADDSQSPENQLRVQRKYAENNGLEIYREYVDRCSGADQHRPALDKMLADARGHRFSTVIVVRVDRIARSMPNLYDVLSSLERAGVGFHCVDQPDISTVTPTGKLMLSILGGVAEFERSLISERTKDGLARARAAGKRLGRPRISVDRARILELRAQGLGYRRIADRLGVSHQTVLNRLKNVGVNGDRETP